MANRGRPRCPTCESAMAPLFAHGPRGKAFIRVKDAFWCPTHKGIARGRRKPKFLPNAPGR